MDTPHNKYIAVAYKLYTVGDGGNELIEEAPKERPFTFISGFGVTLDAFEQQIVELEEGSEFDFVLTKDQAYGDHEAERVLDLDRSIFTINGHFDHEHIYKDAIVPLQNADGNRFYGRVVSVGDEKVCIDLNHPLSGETLNFKGCVIESREATNGEIQALVNRLSGEGCGCGDCGGDCGCDHHDCGGDCGHHCH